MYISAANVKKRVLFGHPKNTAPIRPKEWEYQYGTDDLSKAPAPVAKKLVPPSFKPDDPQPPPGFLHPKAGIFTLKQTTAYQRGYVYTVPYSLDAKTKEADLDRMMRMVAPPQLSPQVDETNKYVHLPVPECVKMIPGVPFALELDGDPHNLHTIGGCHTFESLRYEDDFWEIFEDTVLVAKGLRGCRPAGNTDEVFPITDYPIRTNDRSPADVPQGSKAGSYNLASTLLKGNGPGVVLPAAQVDEPKFAGQVSTILQSLAHLRQRLLRKTLSKYEYEATEFNSGDMNVVGFGGLEPHNATSCQLNLGPIWQLLHKALGLQGSPHPDSLDEETRKTYFLLLLNLPPGMHLIQFRSVFLHFLQAQIPALFCLLEQVFTFKSSILGPFIFSLTGLTFTPVLEPPPHFQSPPFNTGLRLSLRLPGKPRSLDAWASSSTQ
jgi:hypothetical protein